jgi:hypothetical protein
MTRVSNHEAASERLRLLLGEPCKNSAPSQARRTGAAAAAADEDRTTTTALEAGSATRWRPLKLQLYVWQIPSMLLGNAILIFVIGLAIYVFANAQAAPGWGDDQKIGVFFGFCMAFAVVHYFLSWTCVERRVQVGGQEAAVGIASL